jgi:hypothetical protein
MGRRPNPIHGESGSFCKGEIMANMSYCRFHNTLSDLRDCRDALSEMDDWEKELSPEEAKAAHRLFTLCREIAQDYTDMEDD